MNKNHFKDGLNYSDAGVDLAGAADMKKQIIALAQQTLTPRIIEGPGGFGGVLSPWPDAPYHLATSTDGVGTKTRVAGIAGSHGQIGRDLVNHCVNDILCVGAVPLFFLDYIGLGKPDPDLVNSVFSSLADACTDAKCALLGGETAIMPGVYAPGDYEVVGFIVGLLDPDNVRRPQDILPGDIVFGVPSSGLHTNGYSLVRKIFNLDGASKNPYALDEIVPMDGRSLKEALLEPHRSYLQSMAPYISRTRRPMAHITGGGFKENISRVIPSTVSVKLNTETWEVPPIFRFIQERGNVSDDEMFRVFNMGIGMIGFLPESDSDFLREIDGAIEIGMVAERGDSGPVELLRLDDNRL